MLKYIRKRILKYKEKQIKDNFRALKIEIQNYELLKPSVWQRIFKCLKKLYEMYPEIELGVLNLIDTRNDLNNKVAITNFYFENLGYVDTRQIKMTLNAKFFNDVNEFFDAKVSTKENLRLNDFVEWTIAHEFGHLIDIVYHAKFNYTNIRFIEYNKVENFIDNMFLSKMIISNIFKNNSSRYIKNELLKMSDYATKSNKEAFAEAIAFGYFNSKNKVANIILNEFEKIRKEI